MLCHLLGYDVLLDTFPCIVLVSVPLHHPDGQHLGRERPSNSCQPAGTCCEVWGDQAMWNRRWQNMLGTQGFLEAEVATSSGHSMPCNCPWDQGLQLGSWRATGMHRCGIFWLPESGSPAAEQPVLQLRRRHTEAARLYTRAGRTAPGVSLRATVGVPLRARTALLPARALGPGTARPSRSRSGLLRGPRWPLVAARWAERALSCSASCLQGIGRLRVGTRGDKAGRPHRAPGPTFVLFPATTHRRAARLGLCGPGAFPGRPEGRPAPRRVCVWFVHDLPVRIRAIGPSPR